MVKHKLYMTLTIIIALVWGVNGVFCKVLNFVPRHQEIVATILGNTFSRPLTVLIGCSELVMAIWVLSNYKSRFNAITQIGIVLLMNILEFWLVPELLLWARFNILFALGFCILVYVNTFVLKPKTH